jgi:hypothetical protein
MVPKLDHTDAIVSPVALVPEELEPAARSRVLAAREKTLGVLDRGTPVERERDDPGGNLEQELKFLLPGIRASAALAWLRSVGRPDPQFPGGIVSTIYYDTPDLAYLREKVNSDYLKTKVRLRWYEDQAGPPVDATGFLEVKLRIGRHRQKLRVETSYAGTWLAEVPLEHPRLTEVPALIQAQGHLVAARLTPLMLIRYERRRYVHPLTSSRLALDSAIRVDRVNRQLVPWHIAAPLDVCVVEIKGAAVDLPPALYGLTALGARKASFSKYSACYQHVHRLAF